ncbi:MAG: lipopolysaccharide exporter [Solirubrobacteraceae bacterium]|jgi:O-antigen/teichoic acid export membrane protein|nr:lipopolysaccharide exporter [Solirubrobacteraceae bacterium]
MTKQDLTDQRVSAPATGAGGPSLARSAASGVKWTSSAAAAVFAIQIVQTGALAHLLSPRDFGLMAALVVVVGLAQAFADMGMSSAIVVREDVTRERLSSLYWTNVLAGAGVTALVVASTPLVVAFYGEPRLAGLLPWAALAFLVGSLGQQFQPLLQRELRFDVLARIDVVAPLAGMSVAVGAAAGGAGALALVLGFLANSAARSLLLIAHGWRRWRPGLRLRRSDLRGYLSFGAYQMGERTVTFLTANVDYLLVGRFLGAHELGLYSIAYQLVVRPLMLLNPVLTRVATPIFARRQRDDASLRRGFGEITRLLAYVMFPLLGAIAVAAPLLVPTLFGHQWDGSVAVIQILAVVGVLKALGQPIGAVLLGKNRPDLGFRLTLVMLPLLTGALWAVVDQGIVAVAIAYAAVQAGSVVIFLPVVRHTIGLRWPEWLALLAAPAALAAPAILAMWAVSGAASGIGDGVALALVLAAGACVYAALLVAFRRRYLQWLWSLFGRAGSPRGNLGLAP